MIPNRVSIIVSALATAGFLAVAIAGAATAPTPAGEAAAAVHPSAGLMRAIDGLAQETFALDCDIREP